MVEGQPIDRRPPEKSDNRPAFPEQTRAPYHATAPFRVTTLIDKMPAPWSLAFLPNGKILFTERLPGKLRILDTDGKVSDPVAGVSALASPGAKDIGLLDVVLDPHFGANHRIFLSFSTTSTAPIAIPTSPGPGWTKPRVPWSMRPSSFEPCRRCRPRGSAARPGAESQ
jgi:glucose/arabinose dehydrogenase